MEADLRYPVGKYHRPGDLTNDQRREAISDIEQAPARLASVVKNLKPEPTRHAVSSRWMDRAPSCASSSRQPHERLRAHEARAHRRGAHDQAV
jgi:hypothetical protein